MADIFNYNIIEFLQQTDKRNLQTTSRKTGQLLYSMFYEINFSKVFSEAKQQQFLSWLSSHIHHLRNIKKIILSQNMSFKSVQKLLQILVQGRFQLIEFVAPTLHAPEEFTEFFKRNPNILNLQITRPLFVRVTTLFPHLQSLSIPHGDNNNTSTNQIIRFFEEQPLKHLTKVYIENCKQTIAQGLFENLLEKKIKIRELGFKDHRVDTVTPKMKEYMETCGIRLNHLTCYKFNFWEEDDDKFLESLIVPSLQIIYTEQIYKIVLDRMKKCTKLKKIMLSFYSHISISAKEFGEYIRNNGSLVEINNIETKFLSDPNLIFPDSLHTLSVYLDVEENLENKRFFLEKLSASEVKNLSIEGIFEKQTLQHFYTFLSKKKDLQSLEISTNRPLSPEESSAIMNLLILHKSVRCLKVKIDTMNISFIVTFMMNMVQLKKLEIYINWDDYPFTSNQELLPKILQFIDLLDSVEIKMPYLEKLHIIMNVDNLPVFTPIMAKKIKAHCPKLVDVVIGWN
jgi:hypothetical protein